MNRGGRREKFPVALLLCPLRVFRLTGSAATGSLTYMTTAPGGSKPASVPARFSGNDRLPRNFLQDHVRWDVAISTARVRLAKRSRVVFGVACLAIGSAGDAFFCLLSLLALGQNKGRQPEQSSVLTADAVFAVRSTSGNAARQFDSIQYSVTLPPLGCPGASAPKLTGALSRVRRMLSRALAPSGTLHWAAPITARHSKSHRRSG